LSVPEKQGICWHWPKIDIIYEATNWQNNNKYITLHKFVSGDQNNISFKEVSKTGFIQNTSKAPEMLVLQVMSYIPSTSLPSYDLHSTVFSQCILWNFT
jgi:hypothetical protein